MFQFNRETITAEQAYAYLDRIGWEGEAPSPTKENLDRLIYLHQCHVPFENLQIYPVYKGLSLRSEALYEKIVKKRQGGFCFELNGAFLLLLDALGYDAYSVMCRVGNGRTALGRLSHRATLVRIDGKQFICDVGLGGPMAPFAVEISAVHQKGHGEEFWVEPAGNGWFAELRKDSANETKTVIFFGTQFFLQEDFDILMTALLQNPDTIFNRERQVNLRRPDGYVSILNLTLRTQKDGLREERVFCEEDLDDILKRYFDYGDYA